MNVGRRGYAAAIGAAALLSLPLLVGATSGGARNTSRAGDPACGSTITASVTLTADMNCIAGDGIVIGRDGLVVNLNGFKILGTSTGSGISVSSHNTVTIENGVISGFDFGVNITGPAKGMHITNTRVENAVLDDVSSINATDLFVTGSWLTGSGSDALAVSGDTGDQFTKNVIEGAAGSGINASGTGMLISGNLVTNNANGVLSGISGTISGNVTNDNTGFGIESTASFPGVKPPLTLTANRAAFNGGLGISVVAGMAVDGGGNVVQDNGTAAQCANVACHAVSS